LQDQAEELKSQKTLPETLGRESLAPADPQAKIMKTKDGFLPAYNVQTTADNASRLITPCGVTDCPNGFHCLEENLDTLKKQLDTVPKTALPTRVTPMKNRSKTLNGSILSASFRFPTNPK
jgi:hypothetical protein